MWCDYRWLTIVSLAWITPFAQACPQPEDYENYRAQARNETATRELDRRWFRIQEPASRFWPNGIIPYCFDSSVPSQVLLDAFLQDSWKRWIDAGVDNNIVKFQRGSPAQCSVRSVVLWVSLNSQARFATSVGRAPATATQPGPYMTLDQQILGGGTMVDPAADVAHEIGHAIGLLHEHQRPDLWSRTWPDGTGTQDVFKFTCDNLYDYQSFSQRLSPEQLQAACKSVTAGAFTDPDGGNPTTFSATQFLPIPNVPGGPTYVSPGQGTEFDSDSIMLYPSFAFGKSIGGANRANVYTLAGGATIPFNRYPSNRDADIVNAMYRAQSQNPGSFYWLPSSEHQSAFIQLQQGDSCGAGT